MAQCWHTVADQRPKFSTIIERLGYCLQDPDVTNIPLPSLTRSILSPTAIDSQSIIQSSNSLLFTSPSNTSSIDNNSQGNNSVSTVIRSPYTTINTSSQA